ncbi:hypothetical protein ACFXOI_30315 [Streptomyces bacillaris]
MARSISSWSVPVLPCAERFTRDSVLLSTLLSVPALVVTAVLLS